MDGDRAVVVAVPDLPGDTQTPAMGLGMMSGPELLLRMFVTLLGVIVALMALVADDRQTATALIGLGAVMILAALLAPMPIGG